MSFTNPTPTEEYDENIRKLAEKAAADAEKKSPYYGVDWLRGLCDKAGKGYLPNNIDARGVWRTVDGLLKAIAGEQEAREKLDNALRQKDQAVGVLMGRLHAAGVDCSDLIS